MSPHKARTSAVVLGVVAVAGLCAIYVLPVLTYAVLVHDKHWGDFWRTAATPYGAATAGFAALGAGILTYYNGHRERQLLALHHRMDSIHEGDARLGERYGSAAEQLADARPTIREAGVYAASALIDSSIILADQSGQSELGAAIRQATLDLLCSYLRANRGLPALDGSKTTTPIGEDEYVVRAAIVSVLRNKLHRWRLKDENLQVDLRGARLRGANLAGVDLRGAVLVATNFAGTKLMRADLSGANLSSANLCGTDLQEARLDGADLSNSKVNDATLLPAKAEAEHRLTERFRGGAK